MLTTIEQAAQKSRAAAVKLQIADKEAKSQALLAIHEQLLKDKALILSANAQDLEAAKVQVAQGNLSESLVKRLDLSLPGKWEALLEGILQVDALEDPTGKIQLATQLDDGLELYRVTCPIGVLLIIFEARPEVVIQISCLAIKSGELCQGLVDDHVSKCMSLGNAVILKGGKEANQSNAALNESIQKALASLPKDTVPSAAVQLVSTRDEISSLLKLDKYIDLVIPRGSNSLVQHIKENTRIPVLGHADGICSIFVDESADPSKVAALVVDSKTNYPAACNSAETLMIHKAVAQKLLPQIAQALEAKNVKMKADFQLLEVIKSFIKNQELVVEATSQDFDTEFLDHTIAIKMVDSFEQAVEHINCHGSKHTDMIITENQENAKRFMSLVDAAGVYWNASTRFADGFRYGFGAEIGVSPLHTLDRCYSSYIK